ncbi:hypothetical protein J7L48_07495, partial [bacterium]|nr:hypothetical protein [bacterium]
TDRDGTISTYILENIVNKRIPMSVFKVPTGYTKYDNAMQLMMANPDNKSKKSESDNPMMQLYKQIQKEANK